jgi:inorganic pyrophosphatase/exopolyphosphatase
MNQFTETCSGNENRQIAFNAATMKALVASTCTLVAERVYASQTQLSDIYPPDSYQKIMKELSYLLFGVILIDSLNMEPSFQKGTERDRMVLEEIQRETLHYNDSQRLELYTKLLDVKNNESFWKEISFMNCLKYDYKLFFAHPSEALSPTLSPGLISRLGFSSILIPISAFLEKISTNSSSSHPLDDLVKFYRQEQNLDLLVIMSLAEGKREILLITSNFSSSSTRTPSLKSLSSFLSSHNPLLGLEDSPLPKEIFDQELAKRNFVCEWLDQGNITFSRKQLGPMIIQYFENL